MTDLAFRLGEPMAVQAHEGFVVAFSNLPDGGGQLGLFFDPGAADETGRRLRELARSEAGAPMPSGHVERVEIHPPSSAAEMADLRLFLSDGQAVTLTLPIAGLASLARTAEAALAAVAPEGLA